MNVSVETSYLNRSLGSLIFEIKSDKFSKVRLQDFGDINEIDCFSFSEFKM